ANRTVRFVGQAVNVCQNLLLIRGQRDRTHRKHERLRTNVWRRLTMTVDAPLHMQGFDLPDQRHRVDLAVTFHAADTLLNVDVMIEPDEVREVMGPRPPD